MLSPATQKQFRNSSSAALAAALVLLSGAVMTESRIVVYTVGDSTMAPYDTNNAKGQRGWGQALQGLFEENVSVINAARGGRSSKSFIDEGLWSGVLKSLRRGDYVFIQFGHNDEKADTARHTEPWTTYARALRRYVLETRERDALPVLFTPIVRRYFDSTGSITGPGRHNLGPGDSVGNYPAAVRSVAAELHVPLVDMTEMTRSLMESYGSEGSAQLYIAQDKTHPNIAGADAIARLAARGLRAQEIPLSAFLKPGATAVPDPSGMNRGTGWVPDNGDGTFTNPVLFADYSDPDVVRAGDSFYLVSSSFNEVPGLPVLRSHDLVNWKIVGHALGRLPSPAYDTPRHGDGVWAPSIRYHDGEFRIYYGDPDLGVFLVKSKTAEGPWSSPLLVKEARGWIDPCPLWDDDGSVYLVHAWARSRAGFNSILTVNRMSPDGTRILDEGRTVFDGHAHHPTIEGPKFYKRNGEYYILAPAGGVSGGWQVALRSKNVYGPYEDRVVMDRGSTPVNGPHQGGWVETGSGQSWFVHFQQRNPYGRVVHLQPMSWKENWPVIGRDGGGKGEPVLRWTKPEAPLSPVEIPVASDEFDTTALGLQWQWEANPRESWYSLSATPGSLRLYAAPAKTGENLWRAPNLLLEKFPSPYFTVTTLLHMVSDSPGDEAGIVVFGTDYAFLAIRRENEGFAVRMAGCRNASGGGQEVEQEIQRIGRGTAYVRLTVTDGGICSLSYSEDGGQFRSLGTSFPACPGRWVGAKAGLFARGKDGYVDAEWWRVE